MLDLLLWTSIAIPLLASSSAVATKRYCGIATTLSTLFSAIILSLYLPIFFTGEVKHIIGYEWWYLTGKSVRIGLLLDPLSIFMSVLIAFIAFFIMIYSIGYMKKDPGEERFWFFMGAFVSSMLLLVLSDNLLLMLVGWEGVGLSSYFLIGHYYRDEKEHWIGGPIDKAPLMPPSRCATKAILVTGVGDVFMIASILLLYSYTGTFSYLELNKFTIAMPPFILLLISILFLLGPIGKSAQFPLLEWLPEAMAGPTPVSALLHSATMVKAGIYLVARMLPIYRGYIDSGLQEAAWFFILAAWIGGITAIFAALYSMLSLELKKILAYSTISQLGYMLMVLGVAGLSINPVLGVAIAMFHLLSHALFKAALFLGSGIAIHTSKSIYVNQMGGLKRVIPLTFLLMLGAAFSLAGVPPFLSFWSKDAIFAFLISTASLPLLILAFSTSILTAFYALRMIILVFLGNTTLKIHREEKIMIIPIAVFVLLSLILGFSAPYIEESLYTSLKLFFNSSFIYETYEGYEGKTIALILSLIAVATGFSLAYLLYIKRYLNIERLYSNLVIAFLYSILWKRPIDKLYSVLWSFLFVIAKYLAIFESKIDAMLNKSGKYIIEMAYKMRRLQSGDLSFYFSIASLLLLSTIFLFTILWRT